MLSVPRLPGRRSDRRPVAGAPGDAAAGASPDPGGAAEPDPASDPGGAAEPDPGGTGPGLGELVARVADDTGDRRGQFVALTRALASGARGAGRGAGTGVRGLGQLLADVLADAAPRLRVRDAATLRLHHPGRGDDEIADALVRNAARGTAAFGAGVGALAAVQFAAPPTYLAAPIQLAAETLAVAAVEVKLVAELHEIYGEPAQGNGSERGSAYLMSWVRQRAIDPQAGVTGLSAALGYAAKRELRAVLTRRMGRSVAKLAPFLAGAVAGGAVNRRATRALGGTLADELRGRHRTVPPG